jgi:DNA polymerase III subunit gamma/tau
MTDSPSPEGYRVLARKYRPSSFEALIGQEAMVRTLSNAIATGRLAHAFLLTGVRGVGKTSTARLIAKGLNCVGVDGTSGPTISPCDVCDNCVAIAESRHMDVIEMDAASRTGVDDVREIIDAVRYAPVSARYKVYIIDEVHMLSKNAFNALLKTLEEPPPHIKFLFATTEVRKVPVTVLSRCQRFDLRRIPAPMLSDHFQNICNKEQVTVEAEALHLIARAAEGSVRDGLSLLDQAIAHGHGAVTADAVRDMLGLADRAAVLRLMDAVLTAEPALALENLRAQYDQGADPATLVEDLMALTHAITRSHVSGQTPDAPEEERSYIGRWAAALKPAAAHRLWQLLLKGLGDVNAAPSPVEAAEMLLLRIQHAAHMPDPADILQRLQNGGTVAAGSGTPARTPDGIQAARDNIVAHPAALANAPALPKAQMPTDFAALVQLFWTHGEPQLFAALNDEVKLVAMAPGQLEIVPAAAAPINLATRLKACLEAWTGQTWTIALSKEGGTQSLREQKESAQTTLRDAVLSDSLVKAAFATFPGAALSDIIQQPNTHENRSA